MFVQQPLTTLAQRARLLAFVSREPSRHRHVVDLPYRLCSPSAQTPENTAIWSRPDGEIVGFGVVQRQFWSLDYGVAPASPEVFADILAWADRRMRVIANEVEAEYPDGIMNFFDCFEDDTARQAELTAAGYEHFTAWSQVHRWQTLDREPAPLALPEGFTLRPLAGADEAAACAALQRLAFDSTNMTTEWRRGALQAANYTPDLDLVIASPTGELVAFCVGWQMGDQGEIEPIGVHPDFQGHGLGRIILRSCLQRMRRRGIVTAHIEHDNENRAAASLYLSEGFTHLRLVRKYVRRWYPSR